MIGHQVLLAVGDSTSRVLPIKKDGDRYRIRFGTEFGFHPDVLTSTMDSVISATRIAKGYVVEVISCDSGQVVHSWEVAAIEADNTTPCRGRAQPVSSYELRITILEPDPAAFQDHGNADEAGISVLGIYKDRTLIVLILAVLALVALVGVLLERRARSSTNVDTHVVRIGEFLFDKRNMELSYKNERVRLTSKEADLLQLLSASANDTVEREAILASVWGDEGDYVGRTLDVFISKLRKKLEADANVRIVNVRGVGYKLVMGP
ncbi:MAG: winged helix-turn-helix transcriptional regulator [Flavobacteriales bacterium]|nr:winged helix-turn-helix transcriptional regulator [Flavobacteriales bacterium]